MVVANPELEVRDQFFQGLSETPYMWAKWQFLYSENIDTFTEPKGFKISPQPQLLDDMTADANFDSEFILYTKYGVRLAFSKLWHYRVNGTYIGQIPSCFVFYNAIEFQDKIVYAYYAWVVGELKYGFMDVNTTTGAMATAPFSDTLWEISGITQYTVTMFNHNDSLLIIGSWNHLYKIDRVLLTNPAWAQPHWATPTVKLRTRDNVIGITEYQEQFKVYAVSGDKDYPIKTRLYIMNQADLELWVITQVVDLGALNVQSVVADWPIDRAVTSAWLFQIAWTQKIPITQKQLQTDIFTRREITMYDNKFFWRYLDPNTGNRQVLVAGTMYPWLPLQVSPYNKFESLRCMCPANDGIYVNGTCVINGSTKKGTFKVFFDKNNTQVKCATWLLSTRRFFGKITSTIKKIEEFYIWHVFPVDSTITLKIYRDEGNSETLLAMVWTDYTWVPRTRLIANQLTDTVSQEWSRMRLQFDLTRSSSNTVKTPIIFDVLMHYSDYVKW